MVRDGALVVRVCGFVCYDLHVCVICEVACAVVWFVYLFVSRLCLCVVFAVYCAVMYGADVVWVCL